MSRFPGDAKASVLASTLIPCIFRLRFTSLDKDSLLSCARESSFRDHLYFDTFGLLFVYLFSFWICLHFSHFISYYDILFWWNLQPLGFPSKFVLPATRRADE
jgi:hypothetical protein